MTVTTPLRTQELTLWEKTMIRNYTRWIRVAALATAALLPLASQADDDIQYRNKGPYVGGGIGYNQPGDQTLDFRGTKTSPTQPTVPIELPAIQNTGVAAENEYKGNIFYQAVVGYSYQNGFRPEFEIAYRQNDVDDISYEPGPGPRGDAKGVKLTSTSGVANLWYDLFPSWRIHPYIGGGVGFTRFKLNKQPTNQLTSGPLAVNLPAGPPVCLFQDCSGPRKSDDAALTYQAGAGIRWDMLDYLTIGLDYRYQKSGKSQFYGFRDQQETHLDADQDTQSVMLSANYHFFLPTPPPPPAAPTVAAVVPPADADGDGVIDELDKCPGTPLGTVVDAVGCPIPAAPPCKSPLPGEKVLLTGCASGDSIVLNGVNFEFDKARLTVNAKVILDGVAEELVANPQITVELSGHTDSRGSDEYNQTLSESRAASVVEYLSEHGVDSARMTSVGNGESKPVADNDTDEGRELNRRVELKVTSNPGGVSIATPSNASVEPAAAVDATPAPEAEAAPIEPAAEVAPEAAPAESPEAEIPAADAPSVP